MFYWFSISNSLTPLLLSFNPDRRVEYKKGIDGDKTRRLQDEQLANRRIANTNTTSKLPTLADIPRIIGTLQNPMVNRTDRLEVTRMARRMLCAEENPPVEQVIESGLVAFFTFALACDGDPALQFEASWALSKIASTSFTNVVVEAGPIPVWCVFWNAQMPTSAKEPCSAWATLLETVQSFEIWS
jgi:hypothetical protein